VRELGKAGKKVLAHSDDELKIDAEFTRKGVEALMERFEELVSMAYNAKSEGYIFPWK
jgi:hypothetical protein